MKPRYLILAAIVVPAVAYAEGNIPSSSSSPQPPCLDAKGHQHPCMQMRMHRPISGNAAPDQEMEDNEAVTMQLPQVQTQGGVSYVSGGVGLGEREALERMARQFNVKLEMAERDGHYIGDAQVIMRSRNGEEVLNVQPEGPLLYAQLPPGSYNVEVNRAGVSKRQNVTVGSAGMKKLHFYW